MLADKWNYANRINQYITIPDQKPDSALLNKKRAEKAVEHDSDNDSNSSCCPWNDTQRLGKETRRIEKETGGRIETIQNTALR